MWTEIDYATTTEEVAILPTTPSLSRIQRRIMRTWYALLVVGFLLVLNGVFLGVVMVQLGR